MLRLMIVSAYAIFVYPQASFGAYWGLGFLGTRSPKKRSLLFVNEHFEDECNTKITLLDQSHSKYKYLFCYI